MIFSVRLIPKRKIDQLFYNLNKVRSNVSFSKEVEADGQLAYLDVLLTKTETWIESTTYRKNTHTGLYNKCTIMQIISWKACRHYNTKRV